MRIGYFLSTEEYSPRELIEQAVLAEEAGFEALTISDHFHPWNDEQGQAAFVWGVIGAISQRCKLPILTAVTCPTIRLSPVITAQAAATAAVLTEGRFRLGVGTGEALNEHIHGDKWPRAKIRLDMLEEAVDVMRQLWTGDVVNHEGTHYTVEDARIYTLPETPPEVMVSGFGPRSTSIAAEIGDGYITAQDNRELIDKFRDESGGKPVICTTKVAFAPTEEEGIDHAYRLWGTSELPGELVQVLPTPQHFEQGAQLVTKEMTRKSTPAGNDADRFTQHLLGYAHMDETYVANIGPHYRDMIKLFGDEVLPNVRRELGLDKEGGA